MCTCQYISKVKPGWKGYTLLVTATLLGFLLSCMSNEPKEQPSPANTALGDKSAPSPDRDRSSKADPLATGLSEAENLASYLQSVPAPEKRAPDSAAAQETPGVSSYFETKEGTTQWQDELGEEGSSPPSADEPRSNRPADSLMSSEALSKKADDEFGEEEFAEELVRESPPRPKAASSGGAADPRRGEENLLPPGEPAAPVAKSPATQSTVTPAEVKTWKRAQIVANTSRLMIGDREELPLKGMQVDVRIDGFRARVLLDCYFYNDRDRQYEGNFQLRLPNDASPYFFAFGESVLVRQEQPADQPVFYSADQVLRMGTSPSEILSARRETWTQPKEARLVPKEKAALAYTETVRRRVDPALVEWAGAGVFNARVFPLVAQRLHRIVIGYDVELLSVGEDLEYRLDLPEALWGSAGHGSCAIDLDVAQLEGVAITSTPAREPQPATTAAEPQRGHGRLHWRLDNPTEHSLAVRLTRPGPILLTGSDPKTSDYFAARFAPALPAVESDRPLPGAVFLVDVSLSSNPERFNVWLKLLRAILENNRGVLREFAVLFFNIETFWWKSELVPNTPEQVEALLKFANTLALEGATDLGSALQEAARPTWLKGEKAATPWDLFLFSDGAVTWGESELYALGASLRAGSAGALFAYQTGFAGTDTRILAHLTRETGGAIFSVVGETEIAQASTAHRFRPWQLVGVELPGTNDLLLAGRPQILFPGQQLLLTGRGIPSPGASVTLKLRQAGQDQAVATPLAQILSSELTTRVYGEVAVKQLEDFQAATEEFSKAYAVHFRVPGQTCSLLMLESEADYLRYNIKPEEDAFVVKSNPATSLVARVLNDLSQTLSDPKAGFLAWLKKMEAMPGVQFQVTTALRLALEAIPTAQFNVVVPPLHCKARTWEDIPGPLQESLVARNLEYDALTAEAMRRWQTLGPADALRALSSLVENNPGDGVLARDVAFSAMGWGLSGQAYPLLRRVANARPYEPQTYLALARCLPEIGHPDLALAYYEVGLNGQWDSRFGDFRRILGLGYLRFLRQAANGHYRLSSADFAQARLDSVGREFDLGQADLVVVIAWNTDGTDVDLHVIEPTGEECYYSHKNTEIGGAITQDVTRGYGPEMYTLKQAVPGEYQIRVKYFASDSNRASARTKVQATIYQGWGTAQERVMEKVVTLAYGQEMHDIATLAVK